MRAVYLKGTTIVELGVEYLAFASLVIIFSIIAALTYRKQA